ncbi:MAG: hypothetical protein QOG21_2547 [Actinomycetota bacterium]|jgi:broad specificity phosphatase PhoE|nr:hypothetical protein [Actinomycetota bacterium]
MATDQTLDPYRTDSSTTEQVQQQAQQVAQQAKEATQKATSKAQERMRSELDTRTARAGGQIQSTAEDLRSVGEELRKQGKDTPARLADQGADRIEQIARYLTDSDADKMLSDIEDFGRRQPWAVVAGGMALGFLASRFLKASSTRRYNSMYEWRVPASDVRYSSGQLPAYTTSEAASPMSPAGRPVDGYEETYTETVLTESGYDDGTGATYSGGV